MKGGAATREQCTKDLGLYKMLLSITDCKKFEELQKKNCQCIIKKKIYQKRKVTLKNFFKLYTLKKKDDKEIEKLVEKHGTSVSKFAKLMLRMVKKYPKSITVVRDPQKTRMEEMIKRATRGESGGSGGSGGSGEKEEERTASRKSSEKPAERRRETVEEMVVEEDEGEVEDEDTMNLDEM